MGLYFPLPFLLPIFKGGEKKMKRKWLKKAAVTLILAAALIGTSGCGADKAAKAAAGMDIDYYADGELLDRDEAKAQLKAAQKQAEEAKKAKKKQKEETEKAEAAEETEDSDEQANALQNVNNVADTSDDGDSQKTDSKKTKKKTKGSDKSDQKSDSKENSDQKDSGKSDKDKNQDSSDQKGDKDKDTNKNTVTISIRCDTAVNIGMAKEAKWAGIVPESGCILDTTKVAFEDGDTVFDVLCDVRDTYKLQMQYNGSNGGQYIQGINNLYEFDGGRWSGWMYCVNDWYPNYGCGQYVVKNGDVIEWNYTCDLGKDLGQDWMGEDWTETHE